MSASNLRQTLKNVTKMGRKIYKLNRTIRNIKDEDKQGWKAEYYSDTTEGERLRRKSNLGKYLKEKRNALTSTYRDRARTRLIEDEQEARAVQAANEALIAATEREQLQTHRQRRMYEPGVELRLAQEGLSIEEIDREENPNIVHNLFVLRHRRAPIILQDILREADRASQEMMDRIEERAAVERTNPRHQEHWDDYDEDEWGMGIKLKTKKKKTKKKKTKKKKIKKKKYY